MASSQAFTMELNSQPEYQRILEGKPQTQGMRSGRVYLEPGKTCGQHSTKNHEELLVFLSGRGELLLGNGDRLPVGAERSPISPRKRCTTSTTPAPVLLPISTVSRR